MKRGMWLAGALLAMVLGAYTVKAAQGIKEGQWAMTMTIQPEGVADETAKALKEIEKMPPEQRAMMQQMMGGMRMGLSAQGMSISSSQCLTNDNPVPKRDEERDCKQTHATRGNTISFEVVCPDSKSTGQVTYQNDSMEGSIKTVQTKRGQPANVTVYISGKYEGPCRSKS